jgi:Flp pilus assembly protein TadG
MMVHCSAHPSRARRAARVFTRRLLRQCFLAATNEGGASAVEFALVATPFILLVFIALQTALIFFFDQALQTATQQSARMVMTGQTASLNQSGYHAVVCAHLSSMFNCNNLWVDVQSAGTFSALNTAPIVPTYDPHTGKVSNTWQFNQGAPTDVVILRVMYDWPVVGGSWGYADQANGTHLMMATAVFKNEPYDSESGLSS